MASLFQKIVRIIILQIMTAICNQQANIISMPHNHTVYHPIQQYYNYSSKFADQAGPANTVDMTRYGTGTQICDGRACRFFVYLYEPEDKSKISYTILMTSGMHGNELIGPTTLLYAYPLLKPKNVRIIYFPICNPSGYQIKLRETNPMRLDVNRDYPIDKNQNCYQSSATRIIDQIFRKFQIDLTVNLHNGADEIAWNWGTEYNKKFPRTEEDQAYAAIGRMLKYYGGYNNRLHIKPFQVGTMDQIVYPAKGTLDDWAYGGSWSESAMPKCQFYAFEPYPKNMHKGLVFLLQLGEHYPSQNKYGTSQGLDEPSTSEKISNGYITRAIRMLRELVKVTDPAFEVQSSSQQLLIKISGCEQIQNLTIRLDNPKSSNQTLAIPQNQIQTIQNSFTHIFQLVAMSESEQISDNGSTLFYEFKCDRQWLGKGRSFIAKQRTISGNVTLLNNYKLKINGQPIDHLTNKYKTMRFIISVSATMVLILGACLFIKRRCERSKRLVEFQVKKLHQEGSQVSKQATFCDAQHRDELQFTEMEQNTTEQNVYG